MAVIVLKIMTFGAVIRCQLRGSAMYSIHGEWNPIITNQRDDGREEGLLSEYNKNIMNSVLQAKFNSRRPEDSSSRQYTRYQPLGKPPQQRRIMRVERRPGIPRVPLPLQRVQLPIKPTSDRLLRHRQLKRRVARIRREHRRRRVQSPGGAQPEHALHDECLDLGVGKCECGADFDFVEAGDAAWVDAVEPREEGEVVGCAGADVGEGDVGGDVGVAEEGGVVGAVEELGE